LGEVLWDVLPERTCLGGAPANFAYIATLLGNEGIVASRVGVDARGTEARRRMAELGLDVGYLQIDGEHATGVVKVEMDAEGQPHYEIAQPVAWDFLEWAPNWQHLAETADAVCFGSLAQRSEPSRGTIRRFLSATRPATLKVFDVNLRQSYYSAEILAISMKLADIVKLNDEELPQIMSAVGLRHEGELESAKRLLREYDLKMVCVTRGARGSLLVSGEGANEHPGFKVRVADTVGSGDAFTAGLTHEYLEGVSLAAMNEAANLMGAWVASEVGAMPTLKDGVLEHALGEVRQSIAK
jgi:fructokinase